MTLLEILVKELPKRGGWIEGTFIAAQDGNGDVCFYTEGEIMLSRHFHAWLIKPGSTAKHDEENRLKLGMADDWRDSVVTRAQYETALSASKKPEWNGEGLPPVGSNVEVKSPKHGWIVATVTAVTDNWLIAKYSDGVEFAGCHRFLERGVFVEFRDMFRPIRSEAGRKRDEVIGSLTKYTLRGDASDIYDAIAAGKIPGIRIE